MALPRSASATESGLVAAYSFDEGSGSVAHDLVGNHDGNLKNGAAWTKEGKFGGAVQFDGINDLVTVPASAELGFSKSFTVEAWVRPDALPEWDAALAKEAGAFHTYELLPEGEHKAPAAYVGKSSTSNYVINGTSQLSLSQWTHLALTADGEKLRLYVNGILVATATSGALYNAEGATQIGGIPNDSEYFDGRVDEVRIYNRALSTEEISQDKASRVGWSPQGRLVAAYSFDEGSGTIAHDSAGNHDGTLKNGAAWTKEGKFGGAMQFDGINDLVTIADDDALDFPRNFTVEAWVRPESSTPWNAFVSKEGAWEVMTEGGYKAPAGYASKDSEGNDWGVNGTSQIGLNAWTHVALTTDGEKLRLYVNGTLASTGTAGALYTSTGAQQIGGNVKWSEYFKGRVDEVRIYGRTLSAEEISQDKESAIGWSRQSRLVAAYSFDEGAGSVAHDSAGNHDGTLKNGAGWTKEGKFGGAVQFDGIDDLVTIASSSDFDFPKNFTLEAWVRPTESNEWSAVITKETPSYQAYQLHARGEKNAPAGYVSKDKEHSYAINGSSPLPTNSWSHLALTSDGEQLRLFVNGSQVASVPSGAVYNAAGPLQIGGNVIWGEEDSFKGQIDEVRIYGRTLNAEEIGQDKETAIGWTRQSRLVAAYSFDEGAGTVADDSAGNHDGALKNGAEWTPRGRFGDAIHFDGVNDLVTVPASSDLSFAKNFTIEGWVRPDQYNVWSSVFTKETPGYVNYQLHAEGEYESARGSIGTSAEEQARVNGTSRLPVKEWSHLALTSDGEKLRLYVNGKLESTGTGGTALTGEGPLQIGGNLLWGEEDAFKGRLDELRLYSRTLSAEDIAEDARTPVETPPRPPVAAYSLDENQGAVAHDISGGHDGSVEGAEWTDGAAGTALAFDGVDNCLSVPHASELELTEDFTIATWALREGSGVDEPLVFKETEGFFGYALYLGLQETGKVEGLVGESPSEATEVSSPTALPVEVWTHLALSYDGDNLRLYVNGSLVDTTPAEGAQSSKGPLRFGCAEEFGDHYKGRLDEMRVYDRALSGTEIAGQLDRIAPSVTVQGGLVESDDGPLGSTTASVTVAAQDYGEPVSGVAKFWMEVDGVTGPTYYPECPCREAASATLTYDREKWGAGPHAVEIHVVDAAYNETIQRLAVDVPDGPAVSLSGSLYARRGKTVGKLVHVLQIDASQTDGSTAAPRPGVKEIAVKVDGVIDPFPKTQSCSSGNCTMSRTYEFDPTKYSTGAHEIEVRAKDQRDNLTTRTFKVTVKPTDACADYAVNPTGGCAPPAENILHLYQYNGNPSRGGAQLGEEWIKRESLEARLVYPSGAVLTRGNVACAAEPKSQCGEVRSVAPGFTSGKNRYFVTKGSSVSDPNLEVVGEVNKVTLSGMGTPKKTGPLADGLAPWQDPPPGHGTTYSYFESTAVDEEGGLTTISKWWFDTGTGLLLRRTVAASRVQDEQPRIIRFFFSYDQKAYTAEEVSPSLFLVPKPESIEFEWVRQATAQIESPEIVDEEAP